jgi:hypothetical protein
LHGTETTACIARFPANGCSQASLWLRARIGNEIHWLEDDVSRAITIRGFQFIANLALMRR